jgi:hypothetical protein
MEAQDGHLEMLKTSHGRSQQISRVVERPGYKDFCRARPWQVLSMKWGWNQLGAIYLEAFV